jgi:hypothetical protein
MAIDWAATTTVVTVVGAAAGAFYSGWVRGRGPAKKKASGHTSACATFPAPHAVHSPMCPTHPEFEKRVMDGIKEIKDDVQVSTRETHQRIDRLLELMATR